MIARVTITAPQLGSPIGPVVPGFMLTPETIPADKEDQTGGPRSREHSAEDAMEFSSKCAESLVRNGEIGRLVNQVMNPTTVPQGRSRRAGSGSQELAPPQCVGMDPAGGAGSGGRDQEWTPRRR
jgi:hypothetical protein